MHACELTIKRGDCHTRTKIPNIFLQYSPTINFLIFLSMLSLQEIIKEKNN